MGFYYFTIYFKVFSNSIPAAQQPHFVDFFMQTFGGNDPRLKNLKLKKAELWAFLGCAARMTFAHFLRRRDNFQAVFPSLSLNHIIKSCPVVPPS